MSEKNPHIVKEADGEAYTVQRFVTGKPLGADEILPDEHGVYPVSPLGFLMSDEGVPLTSAPNTELWVRYPIYDENGEEIYPENPEHDWDTDRANLLAQTYVSRGKYEFFCGDAARYRVISLARDADTLVVVIDGEIVEPREGLKFFFENATTDDYGPTGILSADGRRMFEPVSTSIEGDRTRVVLDIGPFEVVFNGLAGEGKLVLGVIEYDGGTSEPMKYIVVDPSNGEGASGFYMFGDSPGSPFMKVFAYETMFPPVEPQGKPACNARNGYSNREVADWVESRMSPVIRYGLHPYSVAGELGKAGSFVRWFASCGSVDIAGGGGSNPVMVQGFGLGSGYAGLCSAGTLARPVGHGAPGSVHRELVFGYGTKHDAERDDDGTPALPRDWPFTGFSGYAGLDSENNITLVRHGVTYNGVTYGALERRSIACNKCRGTGLVGGTTCPDCGGTGECPVCDECGGTGELDGHECEHCKGTGHTGTTHLVMDRLHVCLFNDFSPSDGSNGHVDGTTVLKKTFINLATPIGTEDGEELQVTVSLPNVNIDSAFTGNDVSKNLNGYYAYVSQPRVYVVSGTWKFSETRVTFTIDAAMRVLTLDRLLLDKEGSALPSDTAVRMKLSFGCYPSRKFPVTGKVDGTIVTLDEPIADGSLKSALSRESMRDSPRENTSCGAAYVEPNNSTLPSGIENLGLNAVRNGNGALGVDNTGDDGNYNKVYNAHGEHDRPGVLYESDGTVRKDQRQIVATVYPTVTNTFPWSITHRRKLNVLDRMMTMDADAGMRGIYARVFEMDQDIVHSLNGGVTFSPGIYPMDISADTGDISSALPDDADMCSFIGAVLNVGQGGDRPVRQARRAVSMLADDYRKARVKRSGVGPLGSLYMLADGGGIDERWSFGTTVAADDGTANEYEKAAREIRLRHLPPVLATAGSLPGGIPDSPVIQCFPFIDSGLGYYASNPYGFMPDESAALAEETPCEVVDSHDVRVFSVNSVVKACLDSGFSWLEPEDVRDDLKRAAELAAVDMQGEVDLLKPHGERGAGCGWMEAIDAFTKIVSPDNIPVPPMDTGYDYSDIAGKPYLTSGDAYGRYRMENADEVTGDRFISTDLPTGDSLAMFLKDYVPSYAAVLPKRNWDSWRVVLPDDVGRRREDYGDEPVYQTRVKWNPLVCTDEGRGRYAADGIFVGSAFEFEDPNLNRLELDGTVNVDVSSPPYTCPRGYSSEAPFSTVDDRCAVGYIRVFMKFVFSADAGRWYCMDYRQTPVSYLSPLYGAKALEERLPDPVTGNPGEGVRIWNRPSGRSFGWKETTCHLYTECMPLEINPDAVGAVMGDGGGHRRLATPYNPVVTSGTYKGGLGLSAPLDRFGERKGFSVHTPATPHANFWSVYEHIRPAVSVIANSDIPMYEKDGGGVKRYYPAGGIMSDSVLWGQFEYPEKRESGYRLPDTVHPEEELGTSE